jgi:hypothetical protein
MCRMGGPSKAEACIPLPTCQNEGLPARHYAPNQTLIRVNARLPMGIWVGQIVAGGLCRNAVCQPVRAARRLPIDMASHSRGARASGSCADTLETREQGMPDARCTRGPVCKMGKEKRTRAYRFSGGDPTFPAQWFDGLWRALPGDQDLFVTVAPRMMAGLTPGWAGFASARLDANHEAPGPHAFAVRSSAVRLACQVIAHG